MIKQNENIDHYVSDDYIFHGFINGNISVYSSKNANIIKDYDVIMSHSTNADNGIFLLKGKKNYYLNNIDTYSNFYKIISFEEE